MIIENLSDVVILDGNGEPFNESRKYFNRYQSTLNHELRIKELFIKHLKTVGRHNFDRPAVRCEFIYPNYAGGKTRRNIGHFEADFIKDGVYGFPQMIPVETGIKLNFDYGVHNSYADAVLKERVERDN